MSHLILVRHGQSEWNLQKKFTGWVDVDLTPQGKLEACKSGEVIKNQNIKIDYFFSSFQLRAINTLKLIQNTLRNNDQSIKAWQLNERHYGALKGLNKYEMKKKFGEKKILEFRRSWNIKPDPLNKNSPYHTSNIEVYKNLPKENIPDTESKHFCVKEAVLPFDRFPGTDTILGPEMKSTGEVMGIATTFEEAFLKSQVAANIIFPKQGTIFFSIKNKYLFQLYF